MKYKFTHKHRKNISKAMTGKVPLNKGKHTPNEVIRFKNYSKMKLYNRDKKVISFTLIDNDDIYKTQKYRWNQKKTKNKGTYVMGWINGKIYSYWEASIAKDKKRIFLGCFIKKEDAIEARKLAEKMLFGKFLCRI